VWFETFEGNVNRTNTVNFDAHWTSGTPQKGGFEIPLATDSTRLVAKFLPPYGLIQKHFLADDVEVELEI